MKLARKRWPARLARHLAAEKHRFTLVFFVLLFLASTMLPVYGPWVLQARAAEKLALKSPAPLNSEEQKTSSPHTDGITPAAKATAVPDEDPVIAYQKAQEKQKDKPAAAAQLIPTSEIKEKRTAYSNTYLNTEGGETERIYNEPVNYKSHGKGPWRPITSKITDDHDYNKAESAKEPLVSRLLPGKPFVKKGLRQDGGLVHATFRVPSEGDGISVAADGTAGFNVTLLGANPLVNPELGTYEDGQQYILYTDAWQNTDIYYEQRATALKETIVIKDKDAPTTFSFKYKGAKLSYGKDDKGVLDGSLIAELTDGNKVVIPPLSVVSKVKGPLQEPKMHYEIDGNVVRVMLDAQWFKSLPADVFPLLVDPTYDWRGVSTGIPGGDLGQFIAYDSRGYRCNSNICDVYTGSLNDGGWKNWRTMMRLPLTNVYGQSVSWANIYTERVNRPNYWNGFNGNRPYEITWANCFGYNCFSGAPRASAWVDWAANFDATALMQWISTNNVGDGWLMIKAVNEGDINSFKSFAGSRTFLDVNFRHWNQQSALPTLAEPAQNAVVSVSRPTLKLNGVGDPDGDLIRYAFHLLDSKGNVAAHSGELDTPWWTIPDNILVDGETYSWRAFVMERNAGNPSVVESGWRQQPEVRSFKYDMRTGKDKTQTYDDMGALSVSLNRGNAYTGAESHAMNALGGSIGVGLDYNTPDLSRYGLTGYYYNETSAGRQLAITVKDPNIDMIWGTGSPYPGTMQADNFTINWQGFFVAPQDGAYTFGADRDDKASMSLTHDGIADLQFDFTNCCGFSWASKSVTLKRGQAYPISFWLTEFGGGANASLRVRLPSGAEMTVPSEWLRTLPDTAADTSGLVAKFYQTDSGNTNFVVNDRTPLVFMTKVPVIDRDWGEGSLVPYDIGGVYKDFMIANYSGFLTIPADGKYQIGGGSDDGLRIRLGGKEVANSWSPHGYLETWSTEMDLKAGQILPISIDYFEYNYGARANLQWRSSTNAVNTGIIPGQYLTSSPRVVPAGWNLSVDPDGNIPYEQLQAKSSGNVDLVDSDGFVHAYTWTGSGFKPPLNEDGYLIRNSDGTYTLTDTDGRVYTFSVEGLITRVSSAIDDRNPAALQYEYRNTSTATYGAWPKLSRIMDGADPANRYGQLYYWGEQGADTVCTPPSSGFDTPPQGYLCAFKTFPDERVTKLFYKGGQLARVEQPGNQYVDYGYTADGRVSQIRDVLANDAVQAGVREADGSEVTKITYDSLGRVSKMLAPAPFGATVPAGQSNARAEHSFEYGAQDAKRHTTGAPEPKGYQQYVEFDNLYRTTKACNNEGLCNTSEYDPNKDLLLSVTDSLGLKSTTIYDTDDRQTVQYGPAPAAAFKADRTPVDPNAVPRTETKYDEGINGPAVTWYNFKNDSLSGAPRMHTTGFGSGSPSLFWMESGNPAWPGAPITPNDGASAIGLSATAKLYVPTTGTYTLGLNHEDAARVWVNDQLVIDDWAYRSDTITTKTVQINLEGGNKPNRLRYDYANASGGRLAFRLDLSGNGVTATEGQWGDLLRPAYNLQTSQTVYDAQLGNKTNTINYGATPELGLPQTTTATGSGQSLTTSTTYESPNAAPGTGFLRKTSRTLPGGTKSTYTYYDGTQKADNPCTTDVEEQIPQGGQLRTKTTLDPDGSGPETGMTVTTVYDKSGRPIASRTGNEPWSCTEYDARGRTTRTVTPDQSGHPGRTLTADYAVNGNPLISAITDTVTGTVTQEVDLLGRMIKSTDTFGYETKLVYDDLGQLSSKKSLKGTESSTYDQYGRPTSYALDGTTYATMTYDALGQLANVEYPQATSGTDKFKLSQIKRDAAQQNVGAIYTFSDGSTYDESVTRTAQTGLVTGTSVTQGGKTAASSYQYDGLGRLTSATIDNWKYDYGFGVPDAACTGLPGFNADAAKNGNRSTMAVTNTQTGAVTTTMSCYNAADQLISSTDSQVGVPTYDAHGNVTQLAGAGTPITFTYNASDQNIAIAQGDNKVEYTKDAAGNVLVKKEYRGGNLDKVYRNASGVLLSCRLTDQTDCGITDRYIALPGAVMMTLVNTSPTDVKAMYSIQNFHGDSAILVNASGLAASSVSLYDPFGGTVASATFGTSAAPENASDIAMGWATSPSRKQETLFSVALMQMGARVYMPSLGRFLQADPVEGGTPSAYVYVLDPINYADYGGQWGIPKWVKVAAIVVVVAVVVVGVVAACFAVCAAIGAAIAAAAEAAAIAAAEAASAIAMAAIAARTLAPRVAQVASTVIKGSKAVNTVSKGTSTAQAVAKANAPARLTGPVSAAEKGKIGIQQSGVTQNTVKVAAPNSGKIRIPDQLEMRNGTITRIGEVKNVRFQSLTSQLRDYIDIANQNQVRLNLYINSDAKISGPLQGLIDSGVVNKIEY